MADDVAGAAIADFWRRAVGGSSRLS